MSTATGAYTYMICFLTTNEVALLPTHSVLLIATRFCQTACRCCQFQIKSLCYRSLSITRCLICPQANVHEAIVQLISTHRMSTKNPYDDVYRFLVETIHLSVQRAWTAKQSHLITKQSAVAAMLVKALHGFTLIAEQHMVDNQQPLSDRRARPHHAPRATLIRNLVLKPGNTIPIPMTRKFSIAKFVLATHAVDDDPEARALRTSHPIYGTNFMLCHSNGGLWGLMQRLGLLEAALR